MSQVLKSTPIYLIGSYCWPKASWSLEQQITLTVSLNQTSWQARGRPDLQAALSLLGPLPRGQVRPDESWSRDCGSCRSQGH